MERKYTVYKLTSPEGKVYIGCTSLRPERRWRFGRKYAYNRDLSNDVEKFGWDNFDHEIVASGLNEDDAFNMEKELIHRYNSTNPERGYNKAIGGKGSLGFHLTEETKRKISEFNIGEKNPRYGKHLSEETKRKISESHRAKHHTKETRYKMSMSRIGKGVKKVLCVETGQIYESVKQAASSAGCDRSNISSACTGPRKTAGGYHWKYVD